MRKTAKEVSKAVNEQGRAAREIIKAAQSTSGAAKQVRKLRMNKPRLPNRSRKRWNRCAERRSTARALSEQAVAGDQVSKEAVQLARQIGEINKAVSEQAKASAEITTATQSMRLQADQVTKAMREQARTAHEMSAGVNVSKEALRITTAIAITSSGRQNSWRRQRTAPDNNRNADGVKATLTSTSGLATARANLVRSWTA